MEKKRKVGSGTGAETPQKADIKRGGRKKSNTISDEQAVFFQRNLGAMFKKMDTTYYMLRSPQVNSDGDREAFKDYYKLPSYSLLAKCVNFKMNESWRPTKNTAQSIVDFHNANLQPRISLKDFLERDLSKVDFQLIAQKSPFVVDPSFLRSYLAFGWGTTQPGDIGVALIKFYSEEQPQQKWEVCSGKFSGEYTHLNPNKLRAVMVSGLKSLNSADIAHSAQLIEEIVDNKEFAKDVADENSWIVYHGAFEVTASSITAMMSRMENPAQKCVFNLNVSAFHESEWVKPYQGGCGLLMEMRGIHGPKVTKFCLAEKDVFLNLLDLKDPELKEHLSVLSVGEEPISLKNNDDHRWYLYLMKLLDKSKKAPEIDDFS